MSDVSRILYLPIELKVRDLEGRVSLAREASLNNWDVLLIPKNNTLLYLRKLPKGIYIHYGVVPLYQNEIEKIKGYGHLVYAWDEEGLVFLNKEEYLRCRISQQILDKIEGFISWGKYQKEIISEFFPSENKILNFGHPRFDFCMQKRNDINAKKYSDQYKDFILVNTRFGTYNHYNGKEYGQAAKKAKGYYSTKDDNSFYLGMLKFEEQLFNHFVELVEKLANSFPDKAVIVRPHPSENMKFWVDRFKEMQNVIIRNDGNVLDWIESCSVMIHNGCTTAIESVLLEKVSICYSPVTNDKYDIYLPNSVSVILNTTNEIIDHIKQIKDERKNDLLINKLKFNLHDYIAQLDNQSSSCKLIMQSLCKKTDARISLLKRMKVIIIIKCVNIIILFKYLLRKMLLNKKNGENYIRHKLPKIYNSEITACLENRSKSTSFINLSENCFYFLSNSRE